MGDMTEWFAENCVNLLSFVGILFAAYTIRMDAKARRIANYLTLTANYRETWKECFRNQELIRVLDPSADVTKHPVTLREELFMGLVISQMSSFYYAMQDDLVINLEGARQDMVQYLSLPVPKAVWAKTKTLQNRDFVAFVESGRNLK
jgi:hypothetical protein